MVLATAPAPAEDFTAGKTAAQLFHSDCGECHRSPSGLRRDRDVRALADFLREHYTTKSETAGALAAYVSGFAPDGAAARSRGTAPPARDRSRIRSEGGAPAIAEDAPLNTKPADDRAVRPRRTTNLSGDGVKRSVRDDGDAPRPPRMIGTAAKSNARTGAGEPREANDPISRLRSYLSSGLNSGSAIAEAGKPGAPKIRKRRNGAADAPAGGNALPPEPTASPDGDLSLPSDRPPSAPQ